MDSNHQKKLDIIESNQNVQYETNRVSPVDILAETRFPTPSATPHRTDGRTDRMMTIPLRAVPRQGVKKGDKEAITFNNGSTSKSGYIHKFLDTAPLSDTAKPYTLDYTLEKTGHRVASVYTRSKNRPPCIHADTR